MSQISSHISESDSQTSRQQVVKLASKRKNKEILMRREIDELDTEIQHLQDSLKKAIKAKS